AWTSTLTTWDKVRATSPPPPRCHDTARRRCCRSRCRRREGDMPQRVLFITADQQRRDSLPAYGLDFIQAPALERLAREGVVFDRAHTPAPLCVPMRACMLTGLAPSVLGVVDNNNWFSPPIRSWVSDVAADLQTAAIGKMHFYPWDDPHGFADRVSVED